MIQSSRKTKILLHSLLPKSIIKISAFSKKADIEKIQSEKVKNDKE